MKQQFSLALSIDEYLTYHYTDYSGTIEVLIV